jgi:hypothetical protein
MILKYKYFVCFNDTTKNEITEPEYKELKEGIVLNTRGAIEVALLDNRRLLIPFKSINYITIIPQN